MNVRRRSGELLRDRRLAVLSFAVALGACATAAGAFKPAAVSMEEGSLFGRVVVSNLGEDVTKRCYVELTDESEERLRFLSLDATGWLFTAVRPGKTFLSSVSCTVTDSSTFNIMHATRDLFFTVPAGRNIAYFGQVQITFERHGENWLLQAIKPPILQAFQGVDPGPPGKVQVYDRFEEAVREYHARYGAEAARLKPVLALVPLTRPPTPSVAPAALVAPVVKPDAPVSAEHAGAGERRSSTGDAGALVGE